MRCNNLILTGVLCVSTGKCE